MNLDIAFVLSKIRPNAKYFYARTYQDLENSWNDVEQAIPSEKEITDYWTLQGEKELQNEIIGYNREKEYPKIGDQLDAIIKHFKSLGFIGNENGTDLEKIIYKSDQVKNKNKKVD